MELKLILALIYLLQILILLDQMKTALLVLLLKCQEFFELETEG